MNRSQPILIACLLGILAVSGCAEGPLWRSGKYAPWVQNRWAEEEQIANTLFSKKRKMTELVDRAVNGTLQKQQEAAGILSDVAIRDPVLLLRLHAVGQLGRLSSPAAVDALANAAQDRNSDIRLAAIKSFERFPAAKAVPNLQQMIGADNDVDVRLAATRALGNFPGQPSVAAISLALNDPDPALQLRAAESLQAITGESYGRNIKDWQQYVANIPGINTNGDQPQSRVADSELGQSDLK